ncbi:MAG: hypothetical protein R2941_22265 [Desulfobacterales bacterium]
MPEIFDFIYKAFEKMPFSAQMPVAILRIFPAGTERPAQFRAPAETAGANRCHTLFLAMFSWTERYVDKCKKSTRPNLF